MQIFRYQAISPDGKKLSGIIEAPDEYAAVARLREMDAAITKITPVRGHNQAHSQFTTGKISERALSMMCSQFAVILGSGMPIVRAVELIAGQTQDKTLRQILQQAAGDVASGLSLAQSLKNRGKNLPVTFIEMVRSGEESGTLDVAFKRLQTYYDKSFQSKSKVKAAMTYPVFTLIVAAIVVVIIMVVAVPAFTASFSSMGVELPWITRGLIAISGFFTKFWLLLVIVIGGGIFAYQMYGRTEKGKLFHARQRLRLPVLGRIGLLKASAQFAGTLSTLLSAGLPVLQAVSVTASILDNAWIGAKVTGRLSDLEEGKTLSFCLDSAGVFPDLVSEMVRIGEETGSLENTLDMVGVYYDNETDLASRKALSLLEPIIICILAVIVLLVLLAVYLPMFTLYANMG